MIQASFEGSRPIDGGLQQKMGLAWRRKVAAESEIRRGERKVALGSRSREWGSDGCWKGEKAGKWRRKETRVYLFSFFLLI